MICFRFIVTPPENWRLKPENTTERKRRNINTFKPPNFGFHCDSQGERLGGRQGWCIFMYFPTTTSVLGPPESSKSPGKLGSGIATSARRERSPQNAGKGNQGNPLKIFGIFRFRNCSNLPRYHLQVGFQSIWISRCRRRYITLESPGIFQWNEVKRNAIFHRGIDS